jgi:hypothetical protein
MFLVLAVSAALGLLLSLRLARSRVDGARQSADEAKGLLRDWQDKERQRATAATARADALPPGGRKHTLGDSEDSV